MLIAPPTDDEAERLALLQQLGLLDSPPEATFDTVTRLAARLLNVPIALVSLVDADRQWFKARVGLDATETPRDVAFCSHAIHQREPLVVADALLDARFADNPLVTGEPKVRAYAGVPLRSTAGQALGTLCAIDHQPRHFSDDDLRLLQDLAHLVQREIHHKESVCRVVDTLAQREADLRAVLAQSQAAERELVHASFELKDLYNNAPFGYYSLGADGKYLRINETMLAWLGHTRDDVVGLRSPRDFFDDAGRAAFAEVFPRFLAEGHFGPMEFDLYPRQGGKRRVSVMSTALRDDDGQFLMSRTVMYDLTDLDRVRHEVQRINREQGLMLDNDLIGIAKMREGRIIWHNRTLERIFGVEGGELAGADGRQLYLDDEVYQQVQAASRVQIEAGGTYRTQIRMRHHSGEPIWVDLSAVMLTPETGESMWLALDITALKRHQEHVERLAFHGPLTGLPNRSLLMDRLAQAVPLFLRRTDRLAVCFIDLDGFKAVNDTLGHDAGDQLLRVVANRLVQHVRSHDTVARLGGDEFVLLLSHLPGAEECLQILQRVLSAINEPVPLANASTARVSASIGVAFCPQDGQDVSGLLTQADDAMYQAKRAGRNRIQGDFGDAG